MRHLIKQSLSVQKQLPQGGDWGFDFSHTNTVQAFSSFYLWCCRVPAPGIPSTAGVVAVLGGISQCGAAAGELLEQEGLCLGQLALSEQDTTENPHLTNLGPENKTQCYC